MKFIFKIRNDNVKIEKNNLMKFALSPIIKLNEMINIIKKMIKIFGDLFLMKKDNIIKEKK